MDSYALEARGDSLSTVIEQQTQGKGYVKVNAQDIGFAGSTKANISFKINQALNEAAAWGHWRRANDNTQQTAQQVGTDTQLQGILRTSGSAKSDQGKKRLRERRSKRSDPKAFGAIAKGEKN